MNASGMIETKGSAGPLRPRTPWSWPPMWSLSAASRRAQGW